jgi:hypothetical protein
MPFANGIADANEIADTSLADRIDGEYPVGAIGRILGVHVHDAGQLVRHVNLSVFRRHPCGASALGPACKSG